VEEDVDGLTRRPERTEPGKTDWSRVVAWLVFLGVLGWQFVVEALSGRRASLLAGVLGLAIGVLVTTGGLWLGVVRWRKSHPREEWPPPFARGKSGDKRRAGRAVAGKWRAAASLAAGIGVLVAEGPPAAFSAVVGLGVAFFSCGPAVLWVLSRGAKRRG
jgi:hypothetical protein